MKSCAASSSGENAKPAHLNFIEKFQVMAAIQVETKSPFVPLFQRGKFLGSFLTPLWKGEGEIFGWTEEERIQVALVAP